MKITAFGWRFVSILDILTSDTIVEKNLGDSSHLKLWFPRGSLHVFSVMRMPGIVGLVLEMLSRMKCCEREIFTLNSFWRDFSPLFFFIRIRVKLLGIVKNFPSRSCLNYGNRNESLCESRMTGKGNDTRGIFRAFNCDPVWTRNSLTILVAQSGNV